MTKKLEELFDLPEATEIEDDIKIPNLIDYTVNLSDQLPEMNSALASADKIDAALPIVYALDSSDSELDEIATLAQTTFKDLMDLGMNVDSRAAGEIFGTAARMLDTALSAKTAKINKKLKMVDLQLKKATLDAKLYRESIKNNEVTDDGDGQVVDRNALLNEILGRTF